MRTPIFIRPLTKDKEQKIQVGLRSKDGFVLRRGPILLASFRKRRPDRTQRDQRRERVRPRRAASRLLSPHRLRIKLRAEDGELLRDLLHRSLHEFGKGDGTFFWLLIATRFAAWFLRKIEARFPLPQETQSAPAARKKSCTSRYLCEFERS
jgi:hypothetical protein